MSEENVEIVRRIYASVSETLEPPWDLIADDAEADATDASPDIGVARSRDAGRAAIRTYAEMFDDYRVTLEEVIHASADLVVTAVSDGGRIRGSTNEVRNRFFHCFRFRNGQVVRWSTHTSRQQALEAAGLSE